MEKTYYTRSFGPSADPRHGRIFHTVESQGLCPGHFEMTEVMGLPPLFLSHWETSPQPDTYSLTNIFLRAHPNFSSLQFILWPSSWKSFCLLHWYEHCKCTHVYVNACVWFHHTSHCQWAWGIQKAPIEFLAYKKLWERVGHGYKTSGFQEERLIGAGVHVSRMVS